MSCSANIDPRQHQWQQQMMQHQQHEMKKQLDVIKELKKQLQLERQLHVDHCEALKKQHLVLKEQRKN